MVVQSDASLPHIHAIENCFEPKKRRQVVSFGGGVSHKYLKGTSSKKSELEAKLRVVEEENRCMKSRLNALENELQKIKDVLQGKENKDEIPELEICCHILQT
ncbi:unnamed protein product [Cuscuta epithymum]|uniref:Uncharacterized protein n=1 Tax=Cuscuta epithymum TaxID=186058 RepID=A0AAV0CCT0_9ASTE|nr:unnamed protein product [Cuscuta epithymum]